MVSSLPPSIVFAGSFLDHSATVLQGLLNEPTLVTVKGVITTPPAPQGRHQKLTPNPVHRLANSKNLPVFTPDSLDENGLQTMAKLFGGRPTLLLTAGYGKLLPVSWLEWTTAPALNLHFSLLPSYRGANPAEWALIENAAETGVTLIEMSPHFDTGHMVAQAPLPILATSTRESLYQALYQLGADILPTLLAEYASNNQSTTGETHTHIKGHAVTQWQPSQPQPPSPTLYAKRLTRADGFIHRDSLQALLVGGSAQAHHFSQTLAAYLNEKQLAADAEWFERFTRATTGFPSTWTEVTTAKGLTRLKILQCQVKADHSLELLQVQLAGQQPATWNQVKNSILDLGK